MTPWRRQPRDPWARIWSDAGPPTWWLVAALVVSGFAMVAGCAIPAATDPTRLGLPVDWWWYAVIPVAAMLVVSLIDRGGWQIRGALAEFAQRQRERWPDRPTSEEEAAVWQREEAETATPLRRAMVALQVGDTAAARAEIEHATASSEGSKADIVRLKALIDGDLTGRLDLDGARTAVETLPPDERRYQMIAIACAQAYFDVEHGLPWRAAFAATAKELAPFRVTSKATATIALMQFRHAIGLSVLLIVAAVIVAIFPVP